MENENIKYPGKTGIETGAIPEFDYKPGEKVTPEMIRQLRNRISGISTIAEFKNTKFYKEFFVPFYFDACNKLLATMWNPTLNGYQVMAIRETLSIVNRMFAYMGIEENVYNELIRNLTSELKQTEETL